MGDDGLHAAHVAHELELERRLPVLLAEVHQQTTGRRARVVDEDVDALEPADRRVDDLLHVGLAGEIAGHGEHFGAGDLAELGGRRLELALGAGADGDARPFLGEAARHRLADTFAAAGDQRHLAFQTEIHRCAPLSRPPPAHTRRGGTPAGWRERGESELLAKLNNRQSIVNALSSRRAARSHAIAAETR